MQNIVAAMKASATRRLVVISAIAVGESAEQSPWWYRYLMVPTFMRGATADKTAMEAIVRNSNLDWVIARPPVLKDGTATQKVHVLGEARQATQLQGPIWQCGWLSNWKAGLCATSCSSSE